jgi:hypothetical protein
MPIHKAGATGNRNKELYREMARSNWMKPLIATMLDYSRITVFILTPLIFRYHLPLTLTYSSEGSPALAVFFRHHLLKIAISYTCTWLSLQPPFCSYGDIGFLKNCIGQVLAWISGLKVPLLPLGPTCPLQTILLKEKCQRI